MATGKKISKIYSFKSEVGILMLMTLKIYPRMSMFEDQICDIVIGGKWLVVIVIYIPLWRNIGTKHHILRQRKSSGEVIYL